MGEHAWQTFFKILKSISKSPKSKFPKLAQITKIFNKKFKLWVGFLTLNNNRLRCLAVSKFPVRSEKRVNQFSFAKFVASICTVSLVHENNKINQIWFITWNRAGSFHKFWGSRPPRPEKTTKPNKKQKSQLNWIKSFGNFIKHKFNIL